MARLDSLWWNWWVIIANSQGHVYDWCLASDSTSTKLTHSSKILADTWKTFGPLFDVDCTKCIAGQFIPTIETLQRAVRDANTARESDKKSPMSQIRERFLNFTNTLHDYSFLFSIIPDNDKYTILITGVVSSIAKVGFLIVCESRYWYWYRDRPPRNIMTPPRQFHKPSTKLLAILTRSRSVRKLPTLPRFAAS